MPSLTSYRGLQVVTPDPTGDGGLAIQNDLKSLVDWSPKSAWAQSTDPGVNDDSTQSFYPGSLWLRTNTSPPKLFVCQSSSAGAAVWDQVPLELVQDTTPQLGGNLDVNGKTISSSSNGPVVIQPSGTGLVGLYTTTPSYAFHIKKDQNVTQQSALENANTGASSRAVYSAISDSNRYMAFGIESIAYGGKSFVTTSNSDLELRTTNVARLVVKSTGEIQAAATAKLKQTYSDINAATDAATVTFDLALTDLQSVTLGGNRTLALSNAKTGQRFLVTLKQDGMGSRTVTWWSGISWSGGTVPTLTTTANKSDAFEFICTSAGAYLGRVWGQDF